MGDLLWLWIVLGIVGAVIIIWFIWAYNRFISLKNEIDESYSTIEVYMKKRFDLVPNLVNTVKGYTKHETDVIENVTKARTAVADAKTPTARMEGEGELTKSLNHLFAVAEAYPDLKASANYLELQSQLNQIEDDLASARKFYNANVRMYNTMLEQWPARYIARKHNFTKRPLYEIGNQTERENIHVAF